MGRPATLPVSSAPMPSDRARSRSRLFQFLGYSLSAGCLVALWNNLRLSLSLASAGVERIIDGLWMLVAFVITANYVKVPEGVRLSVEMLAVVVFLGVAALLWVLSRKPEAHAVFSES